MLTTMGTENNNNFNNKEDRSSPEYLAQLLKDKKQIQAFPNVFLHAERLIDEGKFAEPELTEAGYGFTYCHWIQCRWLVSFWDYVTYVGVTVWWVICF